MSPRPGVRLGPLVGGILLILLALVIGLFVGGHPNLLPGFLRSAFVDDSKTRLVQETLNIVDDDYYRKVDQKDLVNRSVDGLVGSLHDQFSQYFDPRSYAAFQRESNGEFSGVGTSVMGVKSGLRVAQVFPRSPASKAGIRAGDIIVEVNGKSLAGRRSTEASGLIRGKAGTAVTLTYTRGGHRVTKRLTRAALTVPPVESRTILFHGSKLGYVKLLQFSSGAHGEVGKAVKAQLAKGAKGIVFDLRHNPGGLLDEGVLVSSVFIPRGVIVSTAGRHRPKHVFNAAGPTADPKGPVVVLVDRGTASAAEIVTGAIQDRHRGKVIGTRTYGKGVFQEIRNLSNGGALKITVGEYFTPAGRNLGGGGVKEGRGLNPDVKVSDNLKTKADEALDVALRTLAAEAR